MSLVVLLSSKINAVLPLDWHADFICARVDDLCVRMDYLCIRIDDPRDRMDDLCVKMDDPCVKVEWSVRVDYPCQNG